MILFQFAIFDSFSTSISSINTIVTKSIVDRSHTVVYNPTFRVRKEALYFKVKQPFSKRLALGRRRRVASSSTAYKGRMKLRDFFPFESRCQPID